MPLNIIVTNAGRAAIVNAQNTGTAPVTIAEAGLSQTAVAPLATDTVLAGEFKRIAGVAGEVVADDTIHINVTDESADAYTLRSIGLYLADGTLFAIYGQAGAVLEKTASSIAALSVDVIFADIAAAALTFGNANFTNPPATTERQGVIEIATTAEAQAGVDVLRALTPAAAKAAILGWLLTLDGAGSGLDADLLDGQQGSYYTNITARLGYTPLNKAGDTMTGPLFTLASAAGGAGFRLPHGAVPTTPANGDFWSTTGGLFGRINGATHQLVTFSNDGAGSGLDADLLDGQQGSYYADIVARLGYTPLNTTSYTAADVKAKLLTVDGSGSGVDADLLDGLHAASFVRSDINSTISVRFTFSQGLATGGPVWFGNSALIANDSGGNFSDLSSLNIDHIWHDETNNAWHFCSDTAYRSTGNSKIYGSAFFAGGNTVWHAGNDGAGSGSDADLLDGQQGSYYADIVARLGYTPLNTTSYTAADVKSKLLTVDGAGSGIDADLLDGQQGSYYLAAASYTAADVKAKLVTVDGAGSGVDADLLDGLHASSFARSTSTNRPGVTRLYRRDADNDYNLQTRYASPYWILEGYDGDTYHAEVQVGNAAKLNGLSPSSAADASTVVVRDGDGDIEGRYGYFSYVNISHAQAARNSDSIFFSSNDAFIRKNTAAGFWSSLGGAQSHAANGYVILPSGTIIQWGTFTAVGNSSTVVTYPISFPSGVSRPVVSGGQIDAGRQDNPPDVVSAGGSSFTAFSANDTTVTAWWMAIGY